MNNSAIIKLFCLLFAIGLTSAMAMPEYDPEMGNSVQGKQHIEKEIEDDFRNKRGSDIEERLMELQSKIALAREYAKNLVGHGRFNFDDISKRSEAANELYRLLFKSRERNV